MLVQINSGNGPIECEMACFLYYQELLKEFEDIVVVSMTSRSKDSFQSIVLQSESDLSSLEGTVQWICESPVRKHHQRKNWFIDVSVLEETQAFENDDKIKYEVFRSSGKGGQNVNKVSTAIRAIHIPTGISVVCMEERSQLQNKKIAYLKLIEKLKQNHHLNKQKIEYDNWNKHNQIVRGQPYRVYKGIDFKRVK